MLIFVKLALSSSVYGANIWRTSGLPGTINYLLVIYRGKPPHPLDWPEFFIFCFTDFCHNKLGSEDEIKIKNKIHSNHFPTKLKLKETRNCVSFNFNSVGKWSE